MLPFTTVHELVEETCRAEPRKEAYRFRQNGSWRGITWAEARERVAEFGRALMAHGAAKGDRIGVLSVTSIEWVLADLGIVSSGCVTVGIYPNNTAADCKYILDHAEIAILLLEDDSQLEKILSIRDQLPALETIVNIHGRSDSALGILSWDEFIAGAAKRTEEERLARARSIEADDLASLVYTSGTTGVPKGAMITHRNLVFSAWSAGGAIYHEPDFIVLIFLPLAHVFARMLVYASMYNATTAAIDGDIHAVAQLLVEVRPHYVPCVPRVFEKAHDRIQATVREAGGLKAKLFAWSIGIGHRASRLEQAGEPVPAWLALRRKIADVLVFKKIRAFFGGRLVFAISGSAPLDIDIAKFFHACGILILEGIGMTENTSFSNVNRIDNNRFGTVGPAGRGVEIKISDDGEVLIRAPNVMAGYYKDEQATRETIVDGWLHTGDIGELEDGFLKITDRKKDLIITAGGKNVAPQYVERVLKTSPYISQAAAYGDRRKYITALLTLDADVILPWARENGLGDKTYEQLAAEPAVRRLITVEVERLNGQLARYETIKRFWIVPGDFSVDGGEMTPTMKLKRRVVVEKYRAELDALY
jgi:long-chain acyl-CoA synthetase